MATTQKKRYLTTTWQPATYDVWGNARDGWDINNVFRGPVITLRCHIQTFNPGTDYAFDSASPSAAQIRRIFGLGRTPWDADGDDTCIYVERARDGYPVGELICTSHESLSPPRLNRTPKRAMV